MSIGQSKKLLIVSGHPGHVEEQLNILLNDYATVAWNFLPMGDTVIITVVLVHQSEQRKAALMMGGAHGRPQ